MEFGQSNQGHSEFYLSVLTHHKRKTMDVSFPLGCLQSVHHDPHSQRWGPAGMVADAGYSSLHCKRDQGLGTTPN